MNVLSLFAGIGGLELGLERAGMTVVGQVEINPFCRQVLAKHWPDVPRHDDVRTTVEWWESEQRPHVDLICGGFPCQDISHAGKRAGITGPKSSLWGAMLDTIRHIRPRYVLVENVSALVVRGLDTVAIGSHGICWGRAENGDHRSQLEDFLGWMHVKGGGKRLRGWNVNPTWVDWLMGFPTGWSDLPHSETP